MDRAALVAGRHVFYNRSAFDGDDSAADARDDAPVATDKLALLPGQAASFANVSSYTKGINGVMVDVHGLPGEISAEDFDFEVVSVEGVAARVVAPPPQAVTVRRGAGAGGSDRVTLTWADDAVRNAWLRIAAAERDLTYEDSAIRSAYKNDKTFFEILGAWCEALDKSYPGLTASYATERSRVLVLTAGEDSAPRAISAYTAGSLGVLRAIVERKGHAVAAKRIASEVTAANNGDDSAWRVASNNTNGYVALLLDLLEVTNPERASAIRDSHVTSTQLEDSAVRAQARHKEASAEALHELILNP